MGFLWLVKHEYTNLQPFWSIVINTVCHWPNDDRPWLIIFSSVLLLPYHGMRPFVDTYMMQQTFVRLIQHSLPAGFLVAFAHKSKELTYQDSWHPCQPCSLWCLFILGCLRLFPSLFLFFTLVFSIFLQGGMCNGSLQGITFLDSELHALQG